MCRALVNMADPLTYPIDVKVENQIRKNREFEYEEQRSNHEKILQSIADSQQKLPVFYMYGGVEVNDFVELHLFERRCDSKARMCSFSFAIDLNLHTPPH